MARTYRQKPLWKRILAGFFYTLFCGVILASGLFYGWVKQSPVLWQGMLEQTPFAPARKHFFDDDKVQTLLVLGCDEDLAYGGKKVLKENARSDMMMVVKLDSLNKRVTALTIPRDTLVSVSGYRLQKINAYHALGGAELATEAVEKILPVKIDRVIVLNFQAFQDMVDAAGGVTVYVPKNMKYRDRRANPPLDIDLKKGRQHLDGYDAMCFVRFRHTDSDFHRAERQQDFALAFKDAVLDNKSNLPTIANKAVAVLNGAFDDGEILDLVTFARAVGNDNIKMGTIPVLETNRRDYGLTVDEDKLQETLREFHFLSSSSDLRVSYRN